MSTHKTKDYREEINLNPIDSLIDLEGEHYKPQNLQEADLSEDQTAFFEKLFYRKKFFKESWDKILFIDGKIDSVKEDYIKVACLMDEQNVKFKEKIFPRNLLNHIYPLNEDKFIRIKISQKQGSVRYDIFDADGLNINKKAFTAEKLWKELENFEMDEPLK